MLHNTVNGHLCVKKLVLDLAFAGQVVNTKGRKCQKKENQVQDFLSVTQSNMQLLVCADKGIPHSLIVISMMIVLDQLIISTEAGDSFIVFSSEDF